MHLENHQLDLEGIELLRKMFKESAEHGDRKANTIMALCRELERVMAENTRLRNHLENTKEVDWRSIVKRTE